MAVKVFLHAKSMDYNEWIICTGANTLIGMLLLFSLVNVDVNVSFRMLSLALGSL